MTTSIRQRVQREAGIERPVVPTRMSLAEIEDMHLTMRHELFAASVRQVTAKSTTTGLDAAIRAERRRARKNAFWWH